MPLATLPTGTREQRTVALLIWRRASAGRPRATLDQSSAAPSPPAAAATGSAPGTACWWPARPRPGARRDQGPQGLPRLRTAARTACQRWSPAQAAPSTVRCRARTSWQAGRNRAIRGSRASTRRTRRARRRAARARGRRAIVPARPVPTAPADAEPVPLGAGAGVEADGGGGGQVEALGAAVDRDPDPVVGERGELRGQPVRLVAEQPGRRPAEQPVVGGVVEVDLARAVGGQHRSGRRPAAALTAAAGVVGDRERQVEEAADGGPHGLGVVGVDRVAGQHDGVGARRVGGCGSRCPALPGSRTSAQTATRPTATVGGRATCSSGRSRNRQTATRPCGCTVSVERRQRARPSTGVQPGRAAAQVGVPLAGGRGARRPRPRSRAAPSASSTALGPSARNSRCSARDARRASFRACLTRALPLVRGGAGRRGGSPRRRLRRPWAR